MSLHRIWVAAGISLLGMTTVLAQQAPIPPAVTGSQVTNSDVIVNGQVTGVQDVPTIGGSANGGGMKSPMPGRGFNVVTEALTIQPNQVIMGAVPPGPITVLVTSYGGNNATPMPKVGDSDIFMVQRARDGFSCILSQGVKGIDTLDAVTKLVQAIPFTVKLTAPQSPLYFGQATPVSITLVNNSETAVQITSLNLAGFYYAKRMENYVQSMVSMSKDAAPKFPMDPITLDANGKQTLTVFVNSMAPPSLALLGPDSYVITAASLHIEARYSDGTTTGQNLVARSNWVDAMVGYPHIVVAEPAATPKTEAVAK